MIYLLPAYLSRVCARSLLAFSTVVFTQLVFSQMVFAGTDPATGKPDERRQEPSKPDPRQPMEQPVLLGDKVPGDKMLTPRIDKTKAQDPLVIYDEWLLSSASIEEAGRQHKQLEPLGLKIKRRHSLPKLGFVLTVYQPPLDGNAAARMDELQRKFPALHIEYNQRYPLQALPDAARENSVQRYGYTLTGAPLAGCSSFTGTVAIIDGAVNAALPLFGGRLQAQAVFGSEPEASDHGSAVASLLASLLPKAQVLAITVYRQDADGVLETRSDWLLAGFEKVLAHDPLPAVLNMSFGGHSSLLLERAVRRLDQAGIRLVAAGGNGGPKAAPVYTAAYPAVRAVAAIDLKERVWTGSNRGEYLSFTAPGVDLWLPGRKGEPTFMSGSSFAAPWVSAAAALATEAQWQVPAKLARDLGKPGRDSDFGYGLVQLASLCR